MIPNVAEFVGGAVRVKTEVVQFFILSEVKFEERDNGRWKGCSKLVKRLVYSN